MAWKPQNFASDMSVPSTFSSIRQHSIYSSPVGELLCSVCPLIPLCPVLLIFIHQFVYTTQGSGRKGQKYLLRHTAWSCWGCQMTELTGLCLMTSWMLLSSTSPASVPLLSFLLILTKGLRSETFAICPNWKRASSPTLPLQSPCGWPKSQASPASTWYSQGNARDGDPYCFLPTISWQMWELTSVWHLGQAALHLACLGEPAWLLKFTVVLKEDLRFLSWRKGIGGRRKLCWSPTGLVLGNNKVWSKGQYETGSLEVPCSHRLLLAPPLPQLRPTIGTHSRHFKIEPFLSWYHPGNGREREPASPGPACKQSPWAAACGVC